MIDGEAAVIRPWFVKGFRRLEARRRFPHFILAIGPKAARSGWSKGITGSWRHPIGAPAQLSVTVHVTSCIHRVSTAVFFRTQKATRGRIVNYGISGVLVLVAGVGFEPTTFRL